VRLPRLVFPFIWVVKRINLEEIQYINQFTPYGSRTAKYLYYLNNFREHHFYLTRFMHNPSYFEEMIAIQKLVESVYPSVIGGDFIEADPLKAKNDLLQQNIPRFSGHSIFIQHVIYSLYSFLILGIVGIST
jgi:hypothetical protein